MANTRKYGYFKPVKKGGNPIRWAPKPRGVSRERKKVR